MIPTYYDQNGAVLMGNLRGVGSGGPVRLVSPAPIIINSANGPQAATNNMRLLNNQVRFAFLYCLANYFNFTKENC